MGNWSHSWGDSSFRRLADDISGLGSLRRPADDVLDATSGCESFRSCHPELVSGSVQGSRDAEIILKQVQNDPHDDPGLEIPHFLLCVLKTSSLGDYISGLGDPFAGRRMTIQNRKS